MKSIELSRSPASVPGNRDDSPLSQAKQFFAELYFPSCQSNCPFRNSQRLQEKSIVPVVHREKGIVTEPFCGTLGMLLNAYQPAKTKLQEMKIKLNLRKPTT